MGLFRNLFGPSYREIWEAFSHEPGATYEPGGWFERPRVRIVRGHFVITLCVHVVSHGKTSTTYTRLRAAYRDRSGPRFSLYVRGVFTGIAEWFGAQNLNVDQPGFDESFVLKGNNPEALKQLFSNVTFRQLVEAQPDPRLSALRDDSFLGSSLPTGLAELRYSEVGIVKDPARLKQLVKLMSVTLEELCRIGAAERENPRLYL